MKKKGFTLIELLVVIAIIGLLSTLAIVALNSARQKARDAKRVGDIKQVQTALELYYNDESSYPVGDTITLGSSSYNCLDNSSGFSTGCSGGTTYMGLIPADPQTGTYDYVYTAYTSGGGGSICGAGDTCETYELAFTLEGPTGSLSNPDCIATQEGVTCSGTF